jgi:hypothetical protein
VAKDDITSVTLREPTDAEQDVITWFENQEGKTIDNLEAGARQIITLVTTFFGFTFGVLALGKDKYEVSLSSLVVLLVGWVAVGLLLAALLAALAVVMPRPAVYRESRLDQMKEIYQQLITRKSHRLQLALGFFGGGLAVFAVLIALMLSARLL